MKQAGVTLVELLTVLSISVILLGIGVPGYGYLINNSRLSGLTNDLVTALNYARSEAIKRGVRVSLCKSASVETDSPDCEASAGWQQGWLVFVDRGSVGVMDGEDELIRIYAGQAEKAVVTTTNFSTYASYLPSGVSQGPTHLATGTFLVCLDSEKRSLIINITGRIRIDSKPTGTCL